MDLAYKTTYLKVKSVPLITSAICILIGVSVLIGWATDLTLLKGVHQNLVAMNPLSAICFILASISLITLTSKKTLSLGLATLVLIFSSLKMASFMGLNFPIDLILFKSKLHDNKMAPNTALCFLIASLALISHHSQLKRKIYLPKYLAFVTLVISIFSMLGYTYGIKVLYGVGDFIPMALNTSVCFFCLSIGIILTLPEEGPLAILTREDAGGRMVRRLLPAIFIVPPTLSWMRMAGENMGWYDYQFGVSLQVIIAMGVLAIITFTCGLSLSKSDHQLQDINLDLERKIAQRLSELQQTEKQIQHLQKMDAIGRLAGGVAHDFNNILAAIQLHCEVISCELTNPAHVLSCTEQIRKASERGAGLTQQLLLFSQQKVYRFKSINLNDLIKSHLQMLERLIREDIQIVTKLDAKLPNIQADPIQIEQVVMNLIINARDAMPRGGKIIIETSSLHLNEDFTSTHLTVAAGPCVLLSIRDTGEGMDETTKSQIFDPFFTTKSLGKGTGLGLSTVYGIIKASKATIGVFSELGKGTSFEIYFPASIDQQSTHLLEKESIKTHGHETILLVEDEEALRTLLQASLMKQGYSVLTARDGIEALEVLQQCGEIDLLLTDVIMPNMGGIELATKVLKVYPSLKVLYMSGYMNESLDINAALKEQMNFIQKPFTSQTLARKIRELFS